MLQEKVPLSEQEVSEAEHDTDASESEVLEEESELDSSWVRTRLSLQTRRGCLRGRRFPSTQFGSKMTRKRGIKF